MAGSSLVVRLRNKPELKHPKKGAPANVTSPIKDPHNPDNYPSLIRFLEATGKVEHVTQAVMLRARYLYLRGASAADIAKELKVKPVIIERYALMWSWDEERDRRMFEQFRKIAGAEQMYGKNLGQRHERIAGSIEQVVERLLQQNANGEQQLSTTDLTRMAATIKSTQEIRRTSRGEDVQRKEERREINVNIAVPATMERLASALVSASDRPRLTVVPTKTIAVGTEDEIGSDTEFETTDGSFGQGS